jgi:hypothetical protein
MILCLSHFARYPIHVYMLEKAPYLNVHAALVGAGEGTILLLLVRSAGACAT